jgi:sporadic carbohydrate cluster 2OG-Fe(II) oxygenase
MKKKLQNFVTEFETNGYVVSEVESYESLNFISNFFKKSFSNKYKEAKKIDEDLNKIHNFIKPKYLNNFRVDLFNKFNENAKLKQAYFNLATNLIENIVGNELAMQKRINISIQLPNDKSSLLPLHSDTWSGDSPFEVVLWLPLVDCYQSKSMFILNQKKLKKFNKIYNYSNNKKESDLYKNIKGDLEFIKIKFGQFLLFNQNLPHGNTINKTKETRVSMNCRFKGLFTPYSGKKLGSFFKPLNIKPATKIGLNYKFPDES